MDEASLVPVEPGRLPDEALPALPYVNPCGTRFNLLDKALSFDEAQEALYRVPAPLVIVGSAGSGKTALTLEKAKLATGDVLYVTQSAFLARHARDLYFANGYENEAQNIDFFSFRELLESIRMPAGREAGYREFRAWHARQPQARGVPAHKLFEEFKGVLTGLATDKPFLAREDYLALGVKRSIFLDEERAGVYDLFERYLRWIGESGLYDSNMVSQHYLAEAKPHYDFAVVDEVQDITNVQLALILRLLRREGEFLLSGDSNQIVHPNFFSWAQLKTLFFTTSALDPASLVHVLRTNYRNAAGVNDLANRLLRIKQRRFGSIDRESNYLVETASREAGVVELLAHEPKLLVELNARTRQSTHFAVLVLREDVKAAAREHFQTPLVFSVQEAKGLEYENVILYNFVSCERQSFAAIASGVSAAGVEQGDLEYRRAPDKTDKSLEIYKFFINALYVAVTRAVRKVYLVESDNGHPLLRLLGQERARERIELAEQKSSLEEWQQEAHRLEQQGKLDQAEAVRRTVLHTRAVPWPVLDGEALAALAERALDPQNISNKPRQQIYEYAVLNDEPAWVARLAEVRFEPARGVLEFADEKGVRLVETGANLLRRHYAAYDSRNFKEVLRQVAQYGPDFRNPFNQTPLMIAAARGNVALAETLLERGADVELADNHGRLAYHHALLRALLDAAYAAGPFADLHRLLAPPAVDIMVEERLIKLDAHLIEFFLFNAMLALMQHRLNYPKWWRVGLNVDDFVKPAEAFPERVLPERRKRRTYLSGVLARNEISRDYAYNRRLFARTSRGFYVINPALSLRQGESWTPIYDRLNPPQIDRYLGHRKRVEEIVAFQAEYARDPDAALARLDSEFAADDVRSGDLF
ncbi:MAG: hypothetical protein A3G24_07450 [Betaproteobacteria bacterium RIFCSPLOWO2_12_FULL_62_13]|nr:MAG: hypothetical protein A3G24_07450 [Betaproteobacteria bacterium RIFCSPLOWO2_12_FULL_62_13]